MTIRLLLADDHGMVRVGLRLFLDLDPDIEVLPQEARNGQEAVDLARQTHPDVIVMDILMPVLDGIGATRLIHAELPDISVIALTSVLDDSAASSVVATIEAGAIGYLLKTSDADELRRAVHAAAAGEVQLSASAANRLVREVTAPPSGAGLTGRETQVLVLLSKGKANKEIARELRIGQQTVKTYVSSILAKLGVRSRTEAALYAAQSGLIKRESPTTGPRARDLVGDVGRPRMSA